MPTRTVYTEKDRDWLANVQRIAERLWYEAWVQQGRKDEGTCTSGKGFRIKFRPRNKRIPRDWCIARFDHCQGNISAFQASGEVRRYLSAQGIDAEYYDGRMD